MENLKKENQHNLLEKNRKDNDIDIILDQEKKYFDLENISNFNFKKKNRRSSIENFYSFDIDNCFNNTKKNIDENEIFIFNNFCPFINNSDNEKNDSELDKYYLMSNHSPENSKSNNVLLKKKRNYVKINEEDLKVNFIKNINSFIFRKILLKKKRIQLNSLSLIIILTLI